MDLEQSCPTSTQWEAFLAATLSDCDQAALAAHLDICPRCRAEVERHLGAGHFEGLLPQVDAGQSPRDPVLAHALAQLSAGAVTAQDVSSPRPSGSQDKLGQSAAKGTGPSGNAFREHGDRDPIDTPRTAADQKTIDLSFLSGSDDPRSLGRLGRYEVIERIGRGGMGIVLKALDPGLGRIVAIKVLAPELAETNDARRRFTREARAAAAVCHDNVVTIHAVSEDGILPYLVMQYVAGQSLQKKIDRVGPLGLSEILRIGMQVAAGLAAAHAQGLVHRDIKPANILLENGVERVRITDFGLARAIDDASLTRDGTVAGTPNYMSPEQARGDLVDRRSDLFSLGSTLYTMCTGQPPFRAPAVVAILWKVSDDPPRQNETLSR
jgi:hypothetical protein